MASEMYSIASDNIYMYNFHIVNINAEKRNREILNVTPIIIHQIQRI